MFQPSKRWTEEERIQVLKGLMAEIKACAEDPDTIVLMNYIEAVGERMYYLALGDPKILEKRRSFFLSMKNE